MNKVKRVLFKSPYQTYDCQLVFDKYRNGQTAIELRDDSYPFEGPVAVATVSLDESWNKDEVFIKNYSENEGMLNSLINAGIISNPVRYISSGYVMIPVCKLL